MLTIENRAGVDVLVMGNGCRPASEAESAFYAEITRLRAEIDLVIAQREAWRVSALTCQRSSAEFAANADRLRAEVEALKAELARLTPMMRLEPTGWEFLDWIEPDFLTSIPQGTQLYMIDAARAAQGVE